MFYAKIKVLLTQKVKILIGSNKNILDCTVPNYWLLQSYESQINEIFLTIDKNKYHIKET